MYQSFAFHEAIRRQVAAETDRMERLLEAAALRAIETGRAQEVRVPHFPRGTLVHFFQAGARA